MTLLYSLLLRRTNPQEANPRLANLRRTITRLGGLLALWLTLTVARGQTIRYVTTLGTNTNPATATSWATSTTNL
jgi:hypothetical protein